MGCTNMVKCVEKMQPRGAQRVWPRTQYINYRAGCGAPRGPQLASSGVGTSMLDLLSQFAGPRRGVTMQWAGSTSSWGQRRRALRA